MLLVHEKISMLSIIWVALDEPLKHDPNFINHATLTQLPHQDVMLHLK